MSILFTPVEIGDLKIKEGKTKKAACISCNKCVGALVNDMPLRCYADGLSTNIKENT